MAGDTVEASFIHLHLRHHTPPIVEVRAPDSADEESALQLTLRQAYENFAAAEALRYSSALEEAERASVAADKYFANFPASAAVGDTLGARDTAHGPLEKATITDIRLASAGYPPQTIVSVQFRDGRLYTSPNEYYHAKRFGFIRKEPAR